MNLSIRTASGATMTLTHAGQLVVAGTSRDALVPLLHRNGGDVRRVFLHHASLPGSTAVTDPTAPPKRARVYELAEQLGVDQQAIAAKLQDMAAAALDTAPAGDMLLTEDEYVARYGHSPVTVTDQAALDAEILAVLGSPRVTAEDAHDELARRRAARRSATRPDEV